jgi:pimeloyl-ACP methyl ester carboxylesterase
MPLLGYLAEPAVVAVYDVIGVDIRGVGASTALNCLDPDTWAASFAIDPRNHSGQNLQAQADFNRSFADSCSNDPLTPYITTEQMVRDLDLVRAVLDVSLHGVLVASGADVADRELCPSY